MNPGRFYVPRIGTNFNPMMGVNYIPTRGSVGLFGKITNSLRTFNWNGLLNSANKTLNVVNQTIPLVRQAGPMFSNMKSMLRIARAFGSETNNRNKTQSANNNAMNINNTDNRNLNLIDENKSSKTESLANNYPNFFV